MSRSANPRLFWRLLTSYLLVILVVCITMYLVSAMFSAFFLERQMSSMTRQMQHMSPMMGAMSVDIDAAYRRVTRSSMVWGVLMSAVAAGAVGFFVTQRIVAPLRRMQRASRRIAAGQYRERLDMDAPGEIGELAVAFNDMAASLEQTEARRLELLANVSHEFKTPLSSLKGYLSGLHDGIFQADVETLEACQRQLERLEGLVADLSLLSRVETGGEELQSQPVEVASLLEQAAAAFHPAFNEKGVTLRLGIHDAVSTVLADPLRTSQVLANLLDNALEHTPTAGEVVLSAVGNRSDIRFEVKDSGEGVPADDLPHLFTRFYRVDKSRSHKPRQGSGIGLTIAKHYVERQGGQIGASSGPGMGSSFWFTLPAAGAEP